MYLKNISTSYNIPEEYKDRLKHAGINLIHPIVDILNYVMLDFGQPMHAYDADKISEDISIRFAKKDK